MISLTHLVESAFRREDGEVSGEQREYHAYNQYSELLADRKMSSTWL